MKRKKTYEELHPVSDVMREYVEAAIAERFATGMAPESRAEAIANARRKREEAEQRERMSLADCVEAIVRTAEKATGLSREQLKAKAAEYTGRPAEPLLASKPNRETMLRRGIPETHVAHVFDRLPLECPALAKVREFLEADQQLFLVLTGEPDTRKTGSACWALTREPGRFVVARDLVAIASAPKADGDRWYLVRTAPLLVIDDVGAQYHDEKGYFLTTFNGLIDERYAAARKTILTTNLDPETFAARYEERIARRIRESGTWFGCDPEPAQHWSDR